MTWSPKKTDKLEVRLPTHTKQAFLARCRIEGRSASETVRGFVEEHLARPLSPKELKMIARSPYTYAGLAAACAVGVLIVATAHPSLAQPDYAEAFKSIDRNGDGRLSHEEFGGTAPDSAPATTKPGEGRITISADFAGTDTNQDAAISLAEFTAFNRDAMLKRFLALDADSDGKLTLLEVERPGALLGNTAPEPGKQPVGMAISGPVARLFAHADSDHDGAITEAEWRVSLTRR